MKYEDMLPEIYLTRYETGIYPWRQTNLFTPFWRCYWNLSEGGCLQVGERVIEMRTDRIYIIPGLFRFSTFARKPFGQFYIHFVPPEHVVFSEPGIHETPLTAECRALLREWFELKETGEAYRFRCEVIAAAVLYHALLSLPRGRMLFRESLSPLAERVSGLIRENMTHPLSNSELAARCGTELRTLLRHFRKETGESPQQYSRRIRVEAACRYLRYSDKTIDEIAELTGFPDRYYFSRVFRQLQHYPPAEYRRAQ